MKHKRPLIITWVCLIGFAGGLFAIPMAFSEQAEAIGRIYPPFMLFSAASSLICFAGLWMMKRWSIVGYVALAGVSQAMLIALNTWSIGALIVPGIIIAIGLSKYDLMEPLGRGSV